MQELKQEIKQIIEQEYEVNIDEISLEKPADIKNGNLSTNVCLKNSKVLKKNPLEIGELIIKKLEENNKLNFEKIELVKPGFINFYYSKKQFHQIVDSIITKNNLNFSPKETNINLEFVSANPTGALHLGHARNAVFGDSLANLLTKVGYNVTKEYYINDAGVQMQNLGKSVYAFYQEYCGEKLDFPEDGYRGPEIKAIAKEIFEKFSSTKKEEQLTFFIDYAYEYNMVEIKNIMDKLNIHFDYFASEKSYHENDSVAKNLQILEEKKEVYEQDGAKWLNTTKYGDDKDRVLQKKDGTHTYLTSDIAYHADKFNRGDLLINIWGGDHHGYVNRVKAAIQSLGYNEEMIEIILIQMVSIFDDGEKVKMSKRAGTSVTIIDLLKIIPADVLRYFFIMRSPDTQLDFDINSAQKENSDNPVFYIQYAHARISKLIKKYEEEYNEDLKLKEDELTDLDCQIIDELSEYSNVLNEAANMRRPHIVSNYLYSVASTFHKYYNQEKIFASNLDQTINKIIISKAVQIIIKDGLKILGIEAKQTM